MTATDRPTPPLAAFRGPIVCRRTANSLILTGRAADSADDILILTLIAPSGPELPASLTAPSVTALGERRYRIVAASRDWIVEAISAHVHRDIGNAFHRAIPPRPAPIRKRLFWRVVLALAASRAGKRLLLSLRRR